MMAPLEIDGAPVVAVATVAAGSATGATRHIVAGELANEPIRKLAICQRPGEPWAYLFYFTEDWTIVTDTWHETVQDAFDQAEFEYEGVSFGPPGADR